MSDASLEVASMAEASVGAITMGVAAVLDSLRRTGTRNQQLIRPRIVGVGSAISNPEVGSAMIMAIATLEEFVRETFTVVVGSRPASSSGLSAERLIADSSRSWFKLENLWETELGFPLTNHESWTSIRGMIDARNSIIHGGYRLTAMQLKHEEETVQRLSDAGISFHNGLLRIDATVVHRCATHSASAIRWIDQSVRAELAVN